MALSAPGAAPDPVEEAVNNLEAATTSAPELQKAPGVAVDVASNGGDVTGSSQAVTAAANRQPAAAAAASTNASHEGGLLGAIGSLGHDVLHVGEDVVGDAFKVVNAPLRAVQHEWRYLHDVEARHGLWDALAEGLVIAGSMAAGAVLTGGVGDVAELGALGELGAEGAAEGGAVAGAEGAAGAGAAAGEGAGATAGAEGVSQAQPGLLRQGLRLGGKVLNLSAPARVLLPGEAAGYAMAHVVHPDSWNRTASATYRDPHTHELVNFGNDVAGWFGIHTDRSALSGAANAIFDLAGDPVASLGKMAATAKGQEGLTLGIKGLVEPHTWSRAWSAENIEKLATGTSHQAVNFQRGLQWMADSNMGQILAFDRRLAPIADDLAEAKTPDEVADVYRKHLSTMGTTHSSILPSLSLTRLKMAQIRDYTNNSKVTYLHPLLGGIRHPTALAGNLGKLTTRVPGTVFDDETRTFVNSRINLTNNRDLSLARDSLEMGLGRDQANDIVELMRKSDFKTRRVIWRNAQLMTLLGHAGLDFANPAVVQDAGWFKEARAYALGRVNNPDFREFIQRKVDSLMAPDDPAASGLYGSTPSGETPPRLVDPTTGNESSAALYLQQRGDLPILSYSDIHHMAQQIRGGTMFTGKVDDFLMTHVTDPLFKRWILMSESYATHISLSEMIPNAMRLGFRNFSHAVYSNALARMGQRVAASPEEMDGFTKLAYDMLYGRQRLPRTLRVLGTALKDVEKGKRITREAILRVAPQGAKTMDRMADWQIVTGGHRVTRGVAAHGGLVDSGDDQLGKASGAYRGMMERVGNVYGKKYVYYGPESEEHMRAWRIHLNMQAADPIGRAAAGGFRDVLRAGGTNDDAYTEAVARAHQAIQDLPQEIKDSMDRSTLKPDGTPAHMTAEQAWAYSVADDVEAMTHSPAAGNEPNMTLLNNVASANPTEWGVLHRVAPEDKPLAVPGREILPSPAHFMARLAAVGYQRAINPLVNYLSRQPLMFAEFEKRMDTYAHLETAGVLSHEELVVKSASEATADAIRYVHNIQDRTQFDQLVRNFFPFFFAQEQAYRRMGRLLSEDPGAFRRYQLSIAAVANVVSQQQDAEGNQYIVIPGAGWLDHLVVGALGMIGMPTASLNPTGFGGTLSSANVIFPLSSGVRPDISPVVTLAAQAMRSAFEEFGNKYEDFKPFTNEVQGALNWSVGNVNLGSSIWQQLIPNTTVYRAIQAAAGDDTSFNNAFMETLQNLAYQQNVAVTRWNEEGQKGPMPSIIPPPTADPEQLQAFLAKVKAQTRIAFAMRAIVGFVSPISADVTVSDFGLNAKLQADIASSKSVAAGFEKFLRENPNATPYVVAKSTTPTDESLPDTQYALDWIQQHQQLFTTYQYGALWLMPRPSSAQYSQGAYLEEIANGLRVRDTPAQYLNALYTENGDQIYYASLNAHEAALKAAGGNSGAVNQEYTKWGQYMQTLQKQQPIWWQAYSSGGRDAAAVNSINELNDIFNNKSAPPGQQTDDVKSLLDAFNGYEQQYMQASQTSNYSSAQKQIRDQWIQFVDQLATQKPNLAGVISSVFRDALTTYNAT